MRNAKLFLLVWLTFVLGLAQPVVAQEAETADSASLETLIESIRHNRTQLVAVNIQFTAEEAAEFWPVYEKYATDRNAVADRMVALVQDYAANYKTMTDELASSMVDTMLEIQKDQVGVLAKYADDFGKALPGKKLARFYQLENKLDAVIRFQLARGVPVIAQ